MEGKERARPGRPGVINPFRAMQSERADRKHACPRATDKPSPLLRAPASARLGATRQARRIPPPACGRATAKGQGMGTTDDT